MTLELSELERASLLALVGLAVAVMQDDRESGQEFATMLSAPEMETLCRIVVEKLNETPVRISADHH